MPADDLLKYVQRYTNSKVASNCLAKPFIDDAASDTSKNMLPVVVNDNGKRWRIEHPLWTMQPVGDITTEQARAICEGYIEGIFARARLEAESRPDEQA